MQLNSRIGLVSFSVLLSCLSGTALASSDVKAVLDGWAEASANLKSIKTYRLIGEAVQKDAKGKTEQLKWDILRDGERYYVLWDDGEKKHHQSFDGKLWNGLTETKGGAASGAVFSEPMKSAEVDLDRNLELQAAGRFLLKLSDFADAPANLGGKILREAFAKNDKHLTIIPANAGFELRLDPTIAQQQVLPQRVMLASYGRGLYPVEVTLQSTVGKSTVEYRIVQDGFKAEGDIAYPTHIKATTTRVTDGGKPEALITQETKLTLDLKPAITDESFKIKFPKGAKVNDDREHHAPSPTLATSEPKRSFPFVPVVIGGVIVIIGVIAFSTSRKKK